jgi:DNA-binding NtrC family response regulator
MPESIPSFELLFVDDEPRILESLSALFSDYVVHTAQHGYEALNILKTRQISVIVSDQMMPEMTGVEFLRQAKLTSPDSIRILMTGYADLQAIVDSVNVGEVFRYINKPWNTDKLRETIGFACRVFTQRLSMNSVKTILATTGDRSTPVTRQSPASEASTPSETARTEKLNSTEPVAAVLPLPSASQMNAVPSPTLAIPAHPENLPISDTHLLFVDSNAAHLSAFKTFFEGYYTTHCTTSVSEAFDWISQFPIGVVVADIRLPQMSGADFLIAIKSQRTDISTILMASSADAKVAVQMINDGAVYRYLVKPFPKESLRLTVDSAVLNYKASVANQTTNLKKIEQNIYRTDDSSAKSIFEILSTLRERLNTKPTY